MKEEARENAESLCMALFGFNEKEVKNLVFATLEDVLYVGMKNDVGLILHSWIILLEHQSTYDKYIALRFLEYYLKVTEKIMIEKDEDLHLSSFISLHRPQFIVLYIGKDKILPEKSIRKFADLFMDAGENEPYSPFDVVWYNLKEGYNIALKEKCQPLDEYCWIVHTIEAYRCKGYELTKAIHQTLSEIPVSFSIRKRILANIVEVTGMLEREYTEEEYLETMKRIFTREGKVEAFSESMKTLSKNLMKNHGLSESEATAEAKKLLSL